MLNGHIKPALCIAIPLICLTVISTINCLSYTEYYFSYPAKINDERNVPARSLPAMSYVYFQYYHYSWIAVVAAMMWSVLLIVRKKSTIEDVAVFAAFTVLATLAIAMISLVAFYTANQIFVFKGQHLR